MISMDLTYKYSKAGLNPSLVVPWTSRGIVQGESDLCLVVTPVTSHLGTGTPAGDPLYLKSADSMFMVLAGLFTLAVCFRHSGTI